MEIGGERLPCDTKGQTEFHNNHREAEMYEEEYQTAGDTNQCSDGSFSWSYGEGKHFSVELVSLVLVNLSSFFLRYGKLVWY